MRRQPGARRGEPGAGMARRQRHPCLLYTSRIEFHEITKKAVKDALEHPRPIDMARVDAQQARRALDRLVGYKISPLLWAKVKKGLSAGRVQSVATRLVVEREQEIEAFIPEEYWDVNARFQALNAKGKKMTCEAQMCIRDRACSGPS